jgi:hypothetical protein
VARHITAAISPSTVRRWLAEDVLKPWQHRSWIFPRDPYFTPKAARVLDLCQRIWDGRPLAASEYVLSADEKPGVQARRRIHPALPPAPRRAIRAESEYAPGGTLAYLAAYDVHRAHVIGRCEPTTGIRPFTAPVDQVMSAEPYASARRVYFSILQRKLLVPDDLADLGLLASQILAFQQRYNAAATPSDWKFTRTDLSRLLTRLARHDPGTTQPRQHDNPRRINGPDH